MAQTAESPGRRAVLWLRALAFNIVLFSTMAAVLVGFVPLLAAPNIVLRRAIRGWVRFLDGALSVLVGLDWRIEGRENLPSGGAIVACKHQSAWETFFFFLVFPDVAYVLKKELLSIPFWGWYARHCGAVAIDRQGGGRALKRMIAEAKDLAAAGRTLIIFPEGTRTRPGERRALLPGIAGLAQKLDVPVVPVALDSGRFWGRRAFVKRPGTVTVRFLPAMPKGLAKPDFLAELQRRIETAAADLASGA